MLDGLKTFYKPQSINEIETKIVSFLDAHSVNFEDIDLIITGNNGDVKSDETYRQLAQTIFNKNDTMGYKNLCGEYPTSTAFALWMAANIIKLKAMPAALQPIGSKQKEIKRILIYNQHQSVYHSLLLLSAC